uniref:Uncharacterized protein n=1 Tax=Arundo donax TaxID=35708 RepID=A0A0A9QHB3_ARUDO
MIKTFGINIRTLVTTSNSCGYP